jgi:FMN hydrolase / 5-amino-6-(5-phospho-D-ribitylamino)uracil phosphatase
MSGAVSRAVTFDFGQTLADLDTAMLSRRLGERGLEVAAERLEAAVPAAWGAYDAAVRAGVSGHPWKLLMRELLGRAGAEARGIGGAVDWLWEEQPRKNLWRRPVAGMIELVAALGEAGVPVGVVSNSEGKLAELVEELGWSAYFGVIADSGKLGMEKPGEGIFGWAADRLGVPLGGIVHVGDSYAADVEGAVRAGMRAIWFRGQGGRELPEAVRVASGAAEVGEALAGWLGRAVSGGGVPLQ